ncbi:FAD-dependent oxidoreductase [Craterilacuibacter sp.]|uniref:FAD-dependent oxidoreductase n=1 Tax=Craterilacuibacter sp. TaxID=2870909 RepID=UPI003F315031
MKKLLLIGGGHSHLFVLEALIRAPRPDLDVTLITRDVLAPYSGMLPGMVAGLYSPAEIHIDLAPLCTAAGVRLIHGTVDTLDLDKHSAGAGDLTLAFDLLSLDIGSSPELAAVPGAATYACGVKPIDQFIAALQQLDKLPDGQRIVVVGAGAAGVELALALMAHSRKQQRQDRIALLTRSGVLPRHPKRAAKMAESALQAAGIPLAGGSAIRQVDQGELQLSSGTSFPFDLLFWASGSSPQRWPQAAGLACDQAGFVLVDDHLRSLSHRHVFAGGDIASQLGQSHDKAGVYAVRHGAILAHNLLAALDGGKLKHYRPQHGYLSLLATGDGRAIGCWHGLCVSGRWVWRLKDRIDRGFMARFTRPN